MKVNDTEIRIDGRLIRTARLEGDRYVFSDDPPRLIEALRHAPARIDLFTFMDSLRSPRRTYDYHMELDNLAALPVTTFDEWWTHRLNNKTRNILRRSAKSGLTTREVPFNDDLVRGIKDIYDESPLRQGKPFTHYGKCLSDIRDMTATFMSTSTFIGAYFDDQLIGFAKLVADPGWSQAALMHIVSMTAHRDKAPTNALVAQAVRSCAERRIPHLVYSRFAYGTGKHDSLADFKKHNGFERVDLPRYYVPFTLRGRMALHLRLHHTIRDRLPEAVRAQLRNVRRRWTTLGLSGGQRSE